MAQISLYIPDETAEALRSRAEMQGLSISKFVLEVLDQHLKPPDDGWPPGYRDNCVGWFAGLDWEEPEDLPAPERPGLFD